MKQVPYRLAEALEHICQKKSLEHITVSEIATEAGLTRQVFYHHFADKFELASWIHYVHLYQAVKLALEEDSKQMWRLTVLNWLRRLVENKDYYINAFQSTSQREFQRIIREFLYESHKWQMEHQAHRELTEEEIFVLRTYMYGGMETIYEWVNKGMTMPAERLVELLELTIPEVISKWLLTGEDVPYAEALKMMEKYLLAEGLLQAIS